MGGLRQYMPITFVLMWIATLAIAGIPPFAGFFSKDEILGVGLRARARTRRSPRRRWLGIPGQRAAVRSIYVHGARGGAADRDLHDADDALHLPRPEPDRRERSEQHLREAPWIMTGPLVVLGVLSVVGGWLNLPAFLPLGPAQVLASLARAGRRRGDAAHHAAARSRTSRHARSYALIGVAVAIAVARHRRSRSRGSSPTRSCRRRRRRRSRASSACCANKYYVDEVYDAAIVKPTSAMSRNVLWRGIDAGIIDGLLVNGSASPARAAFGWLGSRLQSGQVGTYAWVLVVGVLARARRLHSPLTRWPPSSHSIGLQRLDPAGAAGASRRSARSLVCCTARDEREGRGGRCRGA